MNAARYAKLHRSGYRLSVPAVATARRVQGLHAIGYTRAELVRTTGLSRKHLYMLATQPAPAVWLTTAQAVERAYQELQTHPKSDTPGAKKIRTYAKKRGWKPPFAWDEETIEDPKARGKR